MVQRTVTYRRAAQLAYDSAELFLVHSARKEARHRRARHAQRKGIHYPGRIGFPRSEGVGVMAKSGRIGVAIRDGTLFRLHQKRPTQRHAFANDSEFEAQIVLASYAGGTNLYAPA